MAGEGRAGRLLGLRPGEGSTVGVAMAASFVASAGLMIGQSAIEALFFARYGVSKLPLMYLVLGGTMFVLTVAFAALLGRLGRGRACLSIPIALALAAAAGRMALAANVGWITQALWLLQGAAQFLVGLAVWGLAGLVTDTRQAKRFFPLIGAGSVLGYVIGGLVTKPLASAVGSPNLLIVWTATLVVVVVLGARLIAIGGDGGPQPTYAGRRRDAGPVDQLVRGFRYVRRSTLMRWMALGSILFSLLFFSLYLPFSRAATARYPDPDELAGFFGVFFGLSTGVAFLLSLFVDESAAGPLRRADGAARVAGPVRGRVRSALDRVHLRHPRRLQVRPGRLDVGGRDQLVGGRHQHGAVGSARSDAGVPVRGPHTGRHRARRPGRARR